LETKKRYLLTRQRPRAIISAQQKTGLGDTVWSQAYIEDPYSFGDWGLFHFITVIGLSQREGT